MLTSTPNLWKATKAIQIFSGVVIARSGSGTREMFVVRRIVQGEGVGASFHYTRPKSTRLK